MADRRFEEQLTAALKGLASDVDVPFDPESIAASAIRSRLGLSRGILGLALAAIILVVAGLQLRQGGEPTASASSGQTSPTPASSEAGEAERVAVLQLETQAYELAYDRFTNSVWLGIMSIGGPDFLYRVDAGTRESERWQLPETLHNGFLTEIEVTDDGGIWIAYEYLLVRFDPETSAMVSHRFPIVQPEADREGGTWISGLGVAGNAVWVSRNGLSLLVLVDSSMDEDRQLELPGTFVGADDVAVVDDDLFVLRPGRDDGLGNVTDGGVGVFSNDGHLDAFAKVQATRLQVVDGLVLARGGDSGHAETAWIGAEGTVDRLEEGVYHVVGAAASAQSAITYALPPGEEPGLIKRHESGSTTILVTFPKELVESTICRHGPQIPTASTSPTAEPSCPPRWLGAPDITAMAVDGSGAIWYLENGGQQGSVLWMVPTGP